MAIQTTARKTVTGGYVQNEIDIRDLLEKWARWRVYRANSYLGWPRADSLGRAMSGMPGTGCPTCGGKGKAPGAKLGIADQYVICPTCGGSGRAQLDVRDKRVVKRCNACDGTGEVDHKWCHKCRGLGQLVEVEKKANPAFIPSTRPKDFDEDTMSQRIDFLICTELTEFQRSILLWEYTRPGIQAEKAEKQGITVEAYWGRLHRAINTLVRLL